MAIKLIPFDYSQPLPAEVREWLDATDAGIEDLDRLIGGVKPDNLHGEVSFGAPVGKEML